MTIIKLNKLNLKNEFKEAKLNKVNLMRFI